MSSDEGSSSLALTGGIGAAVLLASGVMASVVSRRRRQMRGAGVFARLADRSPGTVATEAALRSLQSAELVGRLDIALRAAASHLLVGAPGIAIVGAIVTETGQIDLLLSGPAPQVHVPWVSLGETRWRLPADVDLIDLADSSRRSNQPCPAIAHIGYATSADDLDGGQLFLDLEVAGLLSVEAEACAAADVVRAIAAGVAASPMSEIAHVIAAGLPGVLLAHPLSTDAPSLDVGLEMAAAAIGTTAATTSTTLGTFTLRARHQGGEAWEPAIVFAAGHSTEGTSDHDLLRVTGAGGRGLGVVVDRPVLGADWRLVQEGTHWLLHPLGIEVIPVGLTTDDLREVRELLDDADMPLVYPPDPTADEVTDESLEQLLWAESSAEAAPAEPDWSFMVRLLGPVEVVDTHGTAVRFERSKALELVVWLSQHRQRSTRTAARTALWELDVRDATFANVVSDARRALARAVPLVESEEWIGRTLTEQLPLHAGVVTDAEMLEGCLARARTETGQRGIAELRPALELVRDMPFSGTTYLWPDSEGISSQLTLLVTTAATLLAGHYLALGDTEGVFWSTGQGLRALAGHEELIALRMRAHARHGDLAGVRSEWESYERALNADWVGGEPAPKLLNLRRELLSSSILVQ